MSSLTTQVQDQPSKLSENENLKKKKPEIIGNYRSIVKHLLHVP